MNIYELTQEQEDLLNELFWDEDDELAKARLAQIHGETKNKLEYLSSLLVEAKAITSAREDAKRKATSRLETARNTEERLENFIIETMKDFNIKKVSGKHTSITIVLPGRSSIQFEPNIDYKSLPSDCFEEVTEIKTNKKIIMKHIKDGEELPGVFIVKKPYLMVK